ncbi:MAG: cytochrome c maturation protein CcmE [Gammaproteobacteria bacterium]
MTPRRQRMVVVGAIVLGVAIAAGLALRAFQGNLLYFFSPAQVRAGEAPREQNFRVGGLVVAGSVQRRSGDLTVRFDLTDNAATIPVTYTGILPDLFREGQGIVALGRFGADGVFHAEEVLAKHDENYMPPEVAEALEMSRAGGTMHSASAAGQ